MLADRAASPPAWTPGYRACEVERPMQDLGAKKDFHMKFCFSAPHLQQKRS